MTGGTIIYSARKMVYHHITNIAKSRAMKHLPNRAQFNCALTNVSKITKSAHLSICKTFQFNRISSVGVKIVNFLCWLKIKWEQLKEKEWWIISSVWLTTMLIQVWSRTNHQLQLIQLLRWPTKRLHWDNKKQKDGLWEAWWINWHSGNRLIQKLKIKLWYFYSFDDM